MDALTERIRQRGEANPFWQTLGMEATGSREGWAQLRLPVTGGLRNGPNAPLHGGVFATIIDAAIASALATLLPGDTEAGMMTATLDLNVSFLGAVSEGTLTAEGRILRRGRAIAFGTADVFDDAGELVATGRATYRIRGGASQ